MHLQSQLDPEANLYLISVCILELLQLFPVGGNIQRKIQTIRSGRIIRVQMLGKSNAFQPKLNAPPDHIFHRSAGIRGKRRVHMAVP